MKNSFIFTISIFCSLLFILSSPPASFAHILKTDGAIGGVLHIDPDDDPIVGQQSTIIVELKDTTAHLTTTNCTCTFQIISEGKTLFEQPLFQGSSSTDAQNIVIPFTFPRRDIYEIKILGLPMDKKAFQPFSLTYEIRVARETGNNQALRQNVSFLNTHIPHLIGVGIIIIFILAGLIRKRLAQ